MQNSRSGKTCVHIVQRMAPGGIETLVLDLTRGDEDTFVFSLEGISGDLTRSWGALEDIGARVEGFEASAGLKPALIFKLARRLRALRPQAVFLHHIGPMIYGGIAARLAGVPRVIHVEHDVWHYDDKSRQRIARAIEYVVRPHHVTVSNHAAAALRTMLPAPDVTVIANGIDLERFRPTDKAEARARLGLDGGWKIVGTAGRLTAVKGHEVLVRAAAELPDDCHVVIAGAGVRLEALQKLAKDLGVEGRVHFLGHRDRVETVLPAFDVFCLPSHAEGFPRSVVEAQSVGLPVVATDVGALAEAVCPVSGRIVPPGDASALAAALREVLANAGSTAPRRFVAERYSWVQTLASYREIAEVDHAA